MTPGSSPLKASSRKQSLHSSNLRYTARDLPHNLQREPCLTLNFFWRKCFAIVDFLAIIITSSKGHAQMLQQRFTCIIGRRRGHEGDGHSVCLIDLVIIDLRKDQLILDRQGVVAITIE